MSNPCMQQASFEKEIFIEADVATVLNIIIDYSQYHMFHPLIVKVERVGDAPKGVKRYYITDRLQWGPFKYRTDILSITNDIVHTEAYRSPGTHLTNITRVTRHGDGVILQETVTLRAPDLLFGYVFKQAEAAHEEMLKRIKTFVERQNDSPSQQSGISIS